MQGVVVFYRIEKSPWCERHKDHSSGDGKMRHGRFPRSRLVESEDGKQRNEQNRIVLCADSCSGEKTRKNNGAYTIVCVVYLQYAQYCQCNEKTQQYIGPDGKKKKIWIGYHKTESYDDRSY